MPCFAKLSLMPVTSGEGPPSLFNNNNFDILMHCLDTKHLFIISKIISKLICTARKIHV